MPKFASAIRSTLTHMLLGLRQSLSHYIDTAAHAAQPQPQRETLLLRVPVESQNKR